MNKQQTEIKEYLSQAFRIDQRIQSKMEQVASLNDLATRATATYSDMPGSCLLYTSIQYTMLPMANPYRRMKITITSNCFANS